MSPTEDVNSLENSSTILSTSATASFFCSSSLVVLNLNSSALFLKNCSKLLSEVLFFKSLSSSLLRVSIFSILLCGIPESTLFASEFVPILF